MVLSVGSRTYDVNNGDGINDVFDFGLLRINIDEIQIFNHRGSVVRTLGPDNMQWRGEDNAGNAAEENVYFFSIRSPEPRIHADKLSGYIYLFRAKAK